MELLIAAVISSNIAEIGYDDADEVLYVTFKSGATWCYFAVPYDIYLELLEAPSVGSYFARNIRNIYRALPCSVQNMPH